MVRSSLSGNPVNIIAYQLIIEKDEAPHPHMIGKFGLSIYVPAPVTSMAIPDGLLQGGNGLEG
jgi:hypothetical protein